MYLLIANLTIKNSKTMRKKGFEKKLKTKLITSLYKGNFKLLEEERRYGKIELC